MLTLFEGPAITIFDGWHKRRGWMLIKQRWRADARMVGQVKTTCPTMRALLYGAASVLRGTPGRRRFSLQRGVEELQVELLVKLRHLPVHGLNEQLVGGIIENAEVARRALA